MLGILQKIQRKIMCLYGEYGLLPLATNYLDERDQWDVLIILDGCRYDTFAQTNTFPGVLQKRVSVGTCTPEWGQRTFTDVYPDVMYVSSNPFISKFYFEKWGIENPFFILEEIWDSGWDEKEKTVLPQTVIKVGKKLIKQYPQKKIILHFMQPHHPFIGKKRIEEGGWSKEIGKGKESSNRQPNAYDLVKKGKITRDQALEAYQDNLKLVLQHIEKLLPTLKKKKVIITSDHGNMFGKYGVFAHPKSMYTPQLLEVPWLIVGKS